MTHSRKGHPYKVDREDLALLHAAGWPQKRMAEHFDVSPRSISRNLKALGLTKPGPNAGKRVGPEWFEEARELIDGGASLMEVARTTGVSDCTVTRHFKGQGWDGKTTGQFASAVRWANRELARIGQAPLPSIGSRK